MAQQPQDINDILKRIQVAMQRNQTKVEEIVETHEWLKQAVAIIVGTYHAEKVKSEEKIKKYEGLLTEHKIAFEDTKPNSP